MKNNLLRVIFASTIVYCGACNKSNSSSPAPIATGTMKSVQSQCAESLKSQMKNGMILFVNSPDTTIDDVADAINSEIKVQGVSKNFFHVNQSIRNQSVGSI